VGDVNGDTAHLLERPYLEIVDDILTAMVGGVVNERIVFDLKSDLYALAEPASAVRGLTGTAKGEHVAFQGEVDFQFSAPDNAVVWLDGARPDDETPFFVDYLRRDSRSPLSDLNVGSVTRTLSEAIGREIATVYQQILETYKAAFLETAEGRSLELVVAILDISRKTGELAEGLVTFFGDPAASGSVTIPAGTEVLADQATFETTELRTLQRGQARIDVPVRAAEPFRGAAGVVTPGAINRLAQPINGIVRLGNADPTVLGGPDETDEQLRDRARVALRGLGKATMDALLRVIREQRAELVEAHEPNGPPAQRTDPGSVVLVVRATAGQLPGLDAAVAETRAAGIRTTLVGRFVFVTPRLVAVLKTAATGQGGLTAPGQAKVVEEIIAAAERYLAGLKPGAPALGADLKAAILKDVTDVAELSFADVVTRRADLPRAGPESLVDALLDALAAVPPGDEAARRAALARVLTEVGPPASSGARILDRGLVRGPGGQPATDDEIAAGTFQVVAVVDGEPWSLLLEMSPADVLVQLGGQGG
jgi:Baseplate J-like protein